MNRPAARLLASVGLLSVAVVALQLSIMRLLALTQWHHFAAMVISVALLGFGAAGTVLALWRDRLLAHRENLVPLLMLASAAATALLPWLGRSAFARFDTYLLFSDPLQVGRLLAGSLCFTLPFFLAALAIGMLFAAETERIAPLYCANLLGSGAGGAVGFLLPFFLEPTRLPAAAALFALAAGLIIAPIRSRSAWVAAGLVSVGTTLLGLLSPPVPALSQYKDLSRTMALPGARVVAERHGPSGVVEAVTSPALRWGPALSLAYRGEVPVQGGVFVDGNWFGPLLTAPPAATSRLLDQTTAGLPYVLRSPRSVLVLNAGTGPEVCQAVSHAAHRVVAVEPHRRVAELITEEFPASAGRLFREPAVTLVSQEPRTRLAGDRERYDLIVVPTLGAFGGTTGLLALEEQYLLTTEGFAAIWRHLAPDGIFCVSAWLDYPPRAPLRLAATLTAALAREGVADPAAHLAAVRSWGTITFCVSRSPLTSADCAEVRAFCDRLQFDPVLLPGLSPDERQRFNRLEDDRLLVGLDRLLSPERAAFIADYPFRLRPPTDEQPFFSQFLRWQSLPYLSRLFGERTLPFLEMGYLIAFVTFVELAAAAVLLILLPLSRLRSESRKRYAVFVYFGSLGVGYMFVEMVLIHRFVLYLGPPVLAAAVTITSLLVFSGAGSLCSERLSVSPRTPCRAATLVAVLLLLYTCVLPILLHRTIGWPLAARLPLAFLCLGPLAFVMGVPFPTGLRLLGRMDKRGVPWAWGINGCLSVVGASLATIVAVEAGVGVVQALGALAYGAAALARLRP
jgi:SAM-dependent methyltransferase